MTDGTPHCTAQVLREIYIGCTVATASRILGCVWAAVLLAACLTCHLGRIGIRPIKAYRSSVFTLLRTWPHVVITSVAMVLDDHAWPRVGAVLGRGWVMQLLYSSRLPLTALWSQCLLHVRVPRAQWRGKFGGLLERCAAVSAYFLRVCRS